VRVMSSGDHHWDEHRRFGECQKVHDFMVDEAERRQVDLFLGTGDMYERASTPREREAVSRWLIRMAERCPVLLVKGNHDRPLDMALMGSLKSRHPIIVEEAAGVHYVAGAAVLTMAWPDRATLAAAHSKMSGAELDGVAQDLLRNVMLGLGASVPEHFDGPRIGLGHFMVDGAVTSVGQPLLGQAMNVGLSELALLNCPLVLMGHIHAPQHWSHGGCDIVYTGSPFRTTYGEVEEKSVVVAEYDGARLVKWERVATPCAPMLLLEDEWIHDEADGWQFYGTAEKATDPRKHDLRGAELRFRYKVPVDQQDAARARAELLKSIWLREGAADVKLEPRVIPTSTARAPEVARALTVADKLIEMWKVRGNAPVAPRDQVLLGKAAELEVAS
jgi:DNA repair exonuclease SbcCD nuclease subunit